MAPSPVTDSDVPAIWKRMEAKRLQRVRMARFKISVGQHVRISKEYIRFAKDADQNFSTEIFRIVKVIKRRPRPVYELEDMNYTTKDEQFYQQELTPFRGSKQTAYKINKILEKLVRRGIRDYLVRCRGYNQDFDSWVPVTRVKNI